MPFRPSRAVVRYINVVFSSVILALGYHIIGSLSKLKWASNHLTVRADPFERFEVAYYGLAIVSSINSVWSASLIMWYASTHEHPNPARARMPLFEIIIDFFLGGLLVLFSVLRLISTDKDELISPMDEQMLCAEVFFAILVALTLAVNIAQNLVNIARAQAVFPRFPQTLTTNDMKTERHSVALK